ncbi:hypothetical protein NMY22_g14303 [Coprinellus aureogranulatus]|nr:hypothetical protein NMY22_g14303 [Coprinellus aureogranulatus]
MPSRDYKPGTASHRKDRDECRGLAHIEAQDVAKNLSNVLEKTKSTILPRLNGLPPHDDEYLMNILRKTNLYCPVKKRWRHVPIRVRRESGLRAAINHIFATILQHLSSISEPTDGSTRSVVETFAMPLAHKPVVTEDAKGDTEQQSFRLGIFAKQILYRQANRDCVRCIYITEETVALVHFDRAGVQATQEVRYHLHPEALIRFILAIASFDERELGFDTSIYWSIEEGRKVSGHISVVDSKGILTRYPLHSMEPTIAHCDIQSRGLQIWRAIDPATGKKVIIKDTWLFEAQKPEADFLNQVRGVEGMVQILAQDFGTYPTTAQMRAEPTAGLVEPGRVNKIRYRVVLEEYGENVAHCRDERKLIGALRDGLAALQGLNRLGTIHRDVSPDNFLLGPEGAKPGWRGVIIDLDNACDLGASDGKNNGIGTKGYMSLNVLRCRIDPDFAERYLRDHLDDIESVFWVLCRVAYGWKLPGCHVGMRRFVDFAHCDLTSFELKDAFFQARTMFNTSKILPIFGTPTKRLLQDFSDS